LTPDHVGHVDSALVDAEGQHQLAPEFILDQKAPIKG
jgi:hypothetical protein